jgi:hypothetical protein
MGGKGEQRIAMTDSGLGRAEFESIVEAGILAPSADNRHPLLFDHIGGTVRVWGQDEFCNAPFHRRILLLLSLGAVVENMGLRAQSLGLEARLKWFPDPAEPRLAAALSLSAKPAIANELAAAIPHRHTNRRFFHGPRLSPAQLQQLERDAQAIDGARLVWLDQPDARNKALRLIRLAETERFSCKHLHQELFSAIRFDIGWTGTAEEGIAPGSLEVEWPLRAAFKALRSWKLMQGLATLGAHHLLGLRAGDAPCRFSPHLGVIATARDLEPGSLAVGQAFERVWLRATSWRMALQPLAASTLLALQAYESVRPELRHKLARGWAELAPRMQPLIVFRMGRSSPVTLRSARRTVASYLR